MAENTGDPRGPGMPGSGGWFQTKENPAPERVILGPSRDVDLGFDSYAPAYPQFVDAADRLIVQLNFSAPCVVQLQWVVQRPDGQVIVSRETLPTVGNPLNIFQRNLTEGILISVTVTQQTFFFDEFCYAIVALQRGSETPAIVNATRILCAGYLNSNKGISYPSMVSETPFPGQGAIVHYAVQTPAAGADMAFGISTKRVTMLAFTAKLTTSAAVANRQALLRFTDGTNETYVTPIGAAQAASLVWVYTWAPLPVLNSQFGTRQLIHMAQGMRCAPSDQVQTLTTGLQVGDQWSEGRISFEQWSDFG
jgi:hypothetical protein